MRARAGVVSLRSARAFVAVRSALAAASSERFRIVHFSIQSDHLHAIVEAHDKEALAGGVRGLAIRLARTVNRVLGRHGPLWGDRYHARALTSPRETRNCIRYVLFNFRKHRPADSRRIDPCSSAPWFDGFREPVPRALDPPTWQPTTWLLRTGWRRKRGPLGLDEDSKMPAAPWRSSGVLAANGGRRAES
jgi:putative transposase